MASPLNNMLLGTFLLFFSSVGTVKAQYSTLPPYITFTTSTRVPQKWPVWKLLATPDYPVVTGRTVQLYCSGDAKGSIHWSWERLEIQTWREVGHGQILDLTEPHQSGPYRCSGRNQYRKSVSNVITAYVIGVQPTEIVADNLTIASFLLSLAALIASLAALCWLAWQRLRGTLTPSNTAAKGFPAPEKAPKGGFPQTEGGGDVYMNYTSTNQAYSNLDPAGITGDNVYSSLS